METWEYNLSDIFLNAGHRRAKIKDTLAKKEYAGFSDKTDFMERHPENVRREYELIVEKLEAQDRLSMPEGEKIALI